MQTNGQYQESYQYKRLTFLQVSQTCNLYLAKATTFFARQNVMAGGGVERSKKYLSTK